MRLDAHSPGFTERHGGCWMVLHVPTAKEIRGVIWCDDQTAQYCRYVDWPPRVNEAGDLPTEIVQARRILIDADNRLVLVDPVEGEEFDARREHVEEVLS